jgi:hypothetical protein
VLNGYSPFVCWSQPVVNRGIFSGPVCGSEAIRSWEPSPQNDVESDQSNPLGLVAPLGMHRLVESGRTSTSRSDDRFSGASDLVAMVIAPSRFVAMKLYRVPVPPPPLWTLVGSARGTRRIGERQTSRGTADRDRPQGTNSVGRVKERRRTTRMDGFERMLCSLKVIRSQRPGIPSPWS